MKAFVQHNQFNTDWLNINCFSAASWLNQMGWEVVPFVNIDDIKADLTKETPVIGGIGYVRKAIAFLGCKEPDPIDIPDCLATFARRKVWNTTLKDIHVNEDKWPVFVKPQLDHKIFTGHVVKSFLDLLKTSHLPQDMPVLASEVVSWKSEYRCFVLEGELLDARRYAGTVDWYPKIDQVRKMIKIADPSMPVAYSVDVGAMLDSQERMWDTALIEVNDGFSLGTYGLPSHLQVKMLLARWKEMTK